MSFTFIQYLCITFIILNSFILVFGGSHYRQLLNYYVELTKYILIRHFEWRCGVNITYVVALSLIRWSNLT